MSRPTRGAWIEITVMQALRKADLSRPTRGAWIEISTRLEREANAFVAPHAGRVD